jgi:hypothetical protein
MIFNKKNFNVGSGGASNIENGVTELLNFIDGQLLRNNNGIVEGINPNDLGFLTDIENGNTPLVGFFDGQFLINNSGIIEGIEPQDITGLGYLPLVFDKNYTVDLGGNAITFENGFDFVLQQISDINFSPSSELNINSGNNVSINSTNRIGLYADSLIQIESQEINFNQNSGTQNVILSNIPNIDFSGSTVVGLNYLPLNIDQDYSINGTTYDISFNGFDSISLGCDILDLFGAISTGISGSTELTLSGNNIRFFGDFVDFTNMDQSILFPANNGGFKPFEFPSYTGDNTDITLVAQDLADLRNALISIGIIG